MEALLLGGMIIVCRINLFAPLTNRKQCTNSGNNWLTEYPLWLVCNDGNSFWLIHNIHCWWIWDEQGWFGEQFDLALVIHSFYSLTSNTNDVIKKDFYTGHTISFYSHLMKYAQNLSWNGIKQIIVGPIGVRALPFAAGRNEGSHYFRYIIGPSVLRVPAEQLR